jgi:hypothetical protein
MRAFNRDRPDHDKVRFLGADVLEPRPVQFDELRRYVTDVAPDRREDLEIHLAPIDWRGTPFAQLGWYCSSPRTSSARSSSTPAQSTTWSAPHHRALRRSAATTPSSMRTRCAASTRPSAPTGTQTTSATATSPRSSTAGGGAPGTV